MKYVSGYDCQGNPVYTTTNLQAAVYAKTKDLWATWAGTRYPFPAEVVFQIRYRVPNDSGIYESGFYYTSPAQIFIKGIRATPTLTSSTGSASIQKCCTGNVTFTAANYGDANTFDNWIYPSGWTLISQSGNSITLLPDASTGGTVSCRVGLTTACPAIYKTASINISRTDAAISIVDAEFPLLRICANSSFTYKINPVCGAASYSWQFPTGWTITSGGTTTTVTVSTGSSPQSGNIIVSTNFTGFTSASSTFAINPLTAVPPTPVPDYYHKEYHCDTWNVCFNGSSIYHYKQNEAQTYTYTIVSPWRFLDSGGQPVYTVTLNYNEVPPAISLPAGNTRIFGTYKVKANNCLGSSAELVVPFVREADCWCDGTYPTPYPDGILIETCVTPPCGGGQQMLASPAEEEAALTA